MQFPLLALTLACSVLARKMAAIVDANSEAGNSENVQLANCVDSEVVEQGIISSTAVNTLDGILSDLGESVPNTELFARMSVSSASASTGATVSSPTKDYEADSADGNSTSSNEKVNEKKIRRKSVYVDQDCSGPQMTTFGRSSSFQISVTFVWLKKPGEVAGDEKPQARIEGYADVESWQPGLFEGEVDVRGRPHGNGVMKEGGEASGGEDKRRVYVGSFINGQRSGYGVLTWPSGRRFAGWWAHCRQQGFGTEERPPIKDNEQWDVFSGMFEGGRRQGLGVRRWPEGQRYAGEWHKNRMHGYGVFVWPSGLRYMGRWVDHKRHLCGIEVQDQVGESQEHDSMYAGEWYQGKRNGVGIRRKGSGKIWGGCFSRGRRDKIKTQSENVSAESIRSSVASAVEASEVARNKCIEAQTCLGRHLVGAISYAQSTAELEGVFSNLLSHARDPLVALPSLSKKSANDENNTLDEKHLEVVLPLDLILETAQAKRKSKTVEWGKPVAKQFGVLLRMLKSYAEVRERDHESDREAIRSLAFAMLQDLG